MKTLTLLGLLLAPQLFAQTPADSQEIRQILDRQTKDWNAGNVRGFMVGYWESDSLMYIGKSGVNYGYTATLNSYLKNYPDRAAMGTLRFDIVKLDILSPTTAWVVGKWHLTRPEKGNVGGHYTLLWRKIGGKWVIVADHSS